MYWHFNPGIVFDWNVSTFQSNEPLFYRINFHITVKKLNQVCQKACPSRSFDKPDISLFKKNKFPLLLFELRCYKVARAYQISRMLAYKCFEEGDKWQQYPKPHAVLIFIWQSNSKRVLAGLRPNFVFQTLQFWRWQQQSYAPVYFLSGGPH